MVIQHSPRDDKLSPGTNAVTFTHNIIFNDFDNNVSGTNE